MAPSEVSKCWRKLKRGALLDEMAPPLWRRGPHIFTVLQAVSKDRIVKPLKVFSVLFRDMWKCGHLLQRRPCDCMLSGLNDDNSGRKINIYNSDESLAANDELSERVNFSHQLEPPWFCRYLYHPWRVVISLARCPCWVWTWPGTTGVPPCPCDTHTKAKLPCLGSRASHPSPALMYDVHTTRFLLCSNCKLCRLFRNSWQM